MKCSPFYRKISIGGVELDIKEFERRFNEIEVDEEEYHYNNKRARLVLEYIDKKGINNIRSKELDKIINMYGNHIFRLSTPKITDVYKIVSSRESSKKMTRLTWGMFLFAIITTLATLYGIFY